MEGKLLLTEDMLVAFGGEVKAQEDGKLGGYLVRYSDPKTPDLTGDFFSKETNLGIKDGTTIPMFYQHGFDGVLKTRQIGWMTAKYDDVGMWVELQLELRDEYERSLLEMGRAGKMGLSSGAAGHLVEREQVGKSWHIKTWIIAEGSMTPTPAEPRNGVVPLKSLYQPEVEPPDSNQGDSKMELTEEQKAEISAMLDNSMKASIPGITEAVTASAVTAVKEALPEVLKAALADVSPVNAGGSLGANIKRITDLGFKDDATKTFVHWCKTGDEIAAKAALQEGTDSEGGYLVPEDFYAGIVEKRSALSWIRQAGVQIVTTSLDVYPFPIEDTAMTKFVVTAEEAAADENEPTFASARAEIHRLTKLVKASVQVLADNKTNLESYLMRAFARADAAGENYYFTIGSGVGEPQGVLTGATSSAITTAAAAAITAAEMVQLRGKLGEGYQQEAVWLMQFATKNYIQGLTGNPFQFIATPQGDGDNILQRKVVTSPDMEALAATKKAVLYGNPYFYGVAERATMTVQRLVELYAATGQVGFLAAVRKGGVVLQAEAWQYMTQHA